MDDLVSRFRQLFFTRFRSLQRTATGRATDASAHTTSYPHSDTYLNNTLLVTLQTVLGATAQELTCRRDTANKETNQLQGSLIAVQNLLLGLLLVSCECGPSNAVRQMNVQEPFGCMRSAGHDHDMMMSRFRQLWFTRSWLHQRANSHTMHHRCQRLHHVKCYIRPGVELRRFGCIHTCGKCDATTVDSPPRNHTIECRKRIDMSMVEDLATDECRERAAQGFG